MHLVTLSDWIVLYSKKIKKKKYKKKDERWKMKKKKNMKFKLKTLWHIWHKLLEILDDDHLSQFSQYYSSKKKTLILQKNCII